eukprot:6200047-Pleurochrysis_carterae.AAC.2
MRGMFATRILARLEAETSVVSHLAVQKRGAQSTPPKSSAPPPKNCSRSSWPLRGMRASGSVEVGGRDVEAGSAG